MAGHTRRPLSRARPYLVFRKCVTLTLNEFAALYSRRKRGYVDIGDTNRNARTRIVVQGFSLFVLAESMEQFRR